MGAKNDIRKKAEELKKALLDKKNQEWAKAEIKKRFGDGKAQLEKLEAKLRDPKTRERLERKADELLRKAKTLKRRLKTESKKAEAHVRRNPKKAVAVAAAAGVLAGALWMAFRRKK